MKQNVFVLVAFSFLLYLVFLGFLGSLVFLGLEMSTGLSLADAQEALLGGAGPASVAAGVFRAAQGANQLFGYGLAAMLVGWFLGNPVEELRLDRSAAPSFLILGMGIIVASIPLVQLALLQPEWLSQLPWAQGFTEGLILQEGKSQDLLIALFVNPSPMGLLANLAIFALLPAFCEEAFFRGILQSGLAKKLGPHAGIWLAAAIFSFIHFQFLGFFSRWLLGAMLGYMVYYSGSLWPAIFAHFCFNATSVVGAYYYPEMAAADYQFHGLPVLIAVLLVGSMGALYIRLGQRRLAATVPEQDHL